MKTETRIEITSDTENYNLWLSLDEEGDDTLPVNEMTPEQLKAAAKTAGVSVKTVEFVRDTIEDFKYRVAADLESIWKRLDEMEGR